MFKMAQWIPALFLKALLLEVAAGGPLDVPSAQDNHCSSQVPVSEAAEAQALLQKSSWSTRDAVKASTAGHSRPHPYTMALQFGARPVGSNSEEQTAKELVAEEHTEDETGGGVGGPGFAADLSEEGYKVVAATCCNYQMEEFIRRVINDLGLELCGDFGLMELGTFTCYPDRRVGEKAIQDFTTLRQKIVDSATSACPIAAGPSSCPSDSSTCPGVPDPAYHRRRNCRSGASTTLPTTTTTGPTTTTMTTRTTTQTTTATTMTTTTTRTTTTTVTTSQTTTIASTTTTILEPETTMLTTTVTTTTTTSTGCKGETDVIDMFETELVQSNLGGAGPDFGFEGMRFEDAGISDGQPFDMIVTANLPYRPQKSADNGFECGQPTTGCTTGHFAQISVAAGTHVDLTIQFQDSATQKPMTLSSFIFSLHDIDRLDSSVEEVIYISGFTDGVILGSDTEVVSTLESDGRTKLTSGQDGTACDNPSNPDRLGSVTCSGTVIDQKKRSAAFLFKDTSSIALSLEVTCNKCAANSGRSFLFAGETNLVSCAAKH